MHFYFPLISSIQPNSTENVPKGAQDRPLKDVIIAESGELPLPPAEEAEKVLVKEDL
jgi:hypothetical protein